MPPVAMCAFPQSNLPDFSSIKVLASRLLYDNTGEVAMQKTLFLTLVLLLELRRSKRAATHTDATADRT